MVEKAQVSKQPSDLSVILCFAVKSTPCYPQSVKILEDHSAMPTPQVPCDLSDHWGPTCCLAHLDLSITQANKYPLKYENNLK